MNARTIVTSLIAAALIALEARGAGVMFDYYHTPVFGSSTRVAHGVFSFSDALLGQTIHYNDLDSFKITFYAPAGSSSYDLDYVRTGSFSEYLYFGFNTSANTFVGTSINGFTTYLTAIKPGYADGFWLGISHSGNKLTITDYSQGTQGYPVSSSSIRALPSLRIVSFGTNLVVSWPDFSLTAGFVLQENLDFATTNWSDVPIIPEITNGRKQVIVYPAPSLRLYRLRGP